MYYHCARTRELNERFGDVQHRIQARGRACAGWCAQCSAARLRPCPRNASAVPARLPRSAAAAPALAPPPCADPARGSPAISRLAAHNSPSPTRCTALPCDAAHAFLPPSFPPSQRRTWRAPSPPASPSASQSLPRSWPAPQRRWLNWTACSAWPSRPASSTCAARRRGWGGGSTGLRGRRPAGCRAVCAACCCPGAARPPNIEPLSPPTPARPLSQLTRANELHIVGGRHLLTEQVRGLVFCFSSVSQEMCGAASYRHGCFSARQLRRRACAAANSHLTAATPMQLLTPWRSWWNHSSPTTLIWAAARGACRCGSAGRHQRPG